MIRRTRKASIKDCTLIHNLAQQGFPDTYKDILSDEQMNYMMDWMYSVPNIKKQIQDEGHVYFIVYNDEVPCGYVSIQPEGADLFHLQKIYVLPSLQGMHIGGFLFDTVIHYIKEIHPTPCRMELNVNRNNDAIQFYKHKGMHIDREGDFPIGNGFFMNDYIMAIDI